MPAASVFREEEYRKSHSGGFLHGFGACLSDCVVNCAGKGIALNTVFARVICALFSYFGR